MRPIVVAAVLGLLAGQLGAQTPTTLRVGTPASVDMDRALLDEAVQLFLDAADRGDLIGAVLMVARRGTVVLHEAIGWRYQADRLPMQRDTLFRMASNTKPVIATAVLMLVEEARLSLDEPVAAHLPSFNNERSRAITIRQLLNHTSGFRIRPVFYPFDDESEVPTLQAAVRKFGVEGPEVDPGTSYSYSNAGYNTVGAVIEVVSGQPLETFLVTRVYQPLGMSDTLNHEDPDKRSRMAGVYRGELGDRGGVIFREGWTPGDPADFPVVRASGGMISTASDYARFLQMYLNGGGYGDVQLLTPETIALATTPTTDKGGDGSYGLGWTIDSDGVYSHAGSDGTYAWVDPKRELFGIVLTNSQGVGNPRHEFQRRVTRAVAAR